LSCQAADDLPLHPARVRHPLLEEVGEFGVNFPLPEMERVADFVGATTMPKPDQWAETGLPPVAGFT